MKRLQPTSLLLLLLAAGCVTPSASVTDLTKKNLESAEALANAHEESMNRLGSFLTEVETSELALLKEARTKIARLTEHALNGQLEALRAESRSRFDDELWILRGAAFTARVQRDFRQPFNEALSKDSQSVLALQRTADEYRDDVLAQDDYRQARQSHDLAVRRIDEEERLLEARAAAMVASARDRFAMAVEQLVAHYRAQLRGGDDQQGNSYSSILTAKEVRRVEPRPISYAEHRAALEVWREASVSRLRSHIVALETADSYLRGKRLSFLFVEGAEVINPLSLPPVPTVSTLGLGDVLVELRAREAALEGLAAELDEALQLELSAVVESLTDSIQKARTDLARSLEFLELPR